ncbi:hypothetical protein ACA910_017744 [Epithemia clementina (nom. ined.)]
MSLGPRNVYVRRIPPFFCSLARLSVLLLCTCLNPVGAYDYNSYSSNSGDYGGDYSSQSCPTVLSLCENSVVQVRDVQWACNSPYAYYWGNGAHRNSRVCAYNDKITFQISFRVTDDITEVNDIYVTMAIQEYSSRTILQSKAPSYLCKYMVGTDCTFAGDYSFSFTVRLESPTNSNTDGVDSAVSSSDDFCPVLIMAFSTEADSGYNLGALNMECAAWDSALKTWAQRPKLTPRDWIRNYGMILGTGLCLIVFSGFVWQQARRVTTFSTCVDPCIMELDEYYSYRYPPERPPSIPTTISTQERIPSSSSSSLPLHQQSPPFPPNPRRPNSPLQPPST